jgi:hypothetical protein
MNDHELAIHAATVLAEGMKAMLELQRQQLAALDVIGQLLTGIRDSFEEQGKANAAFVRRMERHAGIADEQPATVRLLHVADDDGPREDA